MKNKPVTLAIIFTALGLLIGISATYSVMKLSNSNYILATTKKAKITRDDIAEQTIKSGEGKANLQMKLGIQVLKDLYPKEYDNSHNQYEKMYKNVIAQAGGREAYEEQLASQGQQLSVMKDQFLFSQMIVPSIMKHYPITEKKLKEQYKKNDNSVYKIEGVVVKDKATADSILNIVKNGTSFKSIYHQFSKDDIKYIGGKESKLKEIVSPYDTTWDLGLLDGLKGMKTNEYKVIKTDDFGYFVVKVNKKETMKYKDAKNELKSQYIKTLLNNGGDIVNKALKKDFKKAGVKIKDKFFEDLATPNYRSN